MHAAAPQLTPAASALRFALCARWAIALTVTTNTRLPMPAPPPCPLPRPLPSREGDTPGPGLPAGPLALVLKAASHPRFQRAGCDLTARVRLPLSNALVGGAVPVKTLDGR